MNAFQVVAGLEVAILLILLLCVLVAIPIADRKGRSRIEACLLAVFLGPLGLVVAWLLPARQTEGVSQRRPFQFSLRTLLLFVLVLSLLASWLAVTLEQTRRQKAVLAHLAEYDHVAYWRYGYLGKGEANEIPLGYVIDLRLWGDQRSAPKDDDLAHLVGLTELQALTIQNCPGVTDAGLVHLGKLSKLEDLDLNHCTNVGDGGLEHLKGLSRLESLNLAGTRGTDAGLEHLKGMTSLRTLFLGGTQVTDAGLERL